MLATDPAFELLLNERPECAALRTAAKPADHLAGTMMHLNHNNLRLLSALLQHTLRHLMSHTVIN